MFRFIGSMLWVNDTGLLYTTQITEFSSTNGQSFNDISVFISLRSIAICVGAHHVTKFRPLFTIIMSHIRIAQYGVKRLLFPAS